MAQPTRLKLTRAQLSAFLKDPESIRQFERLFSVADTDLPSITILIENAQITAEGADAKADQALGTIQSIMTDLEFAATAPPVVPPVRLRRGQFLSSVTQTAAVANTAYGVLFNTTQLSIGVDVGSPTSRLVVDTEGLYVAVASLQAEKTSAGAGTLFSWWRINGVDVASSTRSRVINGSDADGPLVMSSVFSLKAGDYIEVEWEVDSTAIQLTASAATGVHPANGSAQLSVWAI